MNIIDIVSSFLKRYHNPKHPLLLALSGGPDSIALFYALVECRQRHLLSALGVAHIDHRWRESSEREAQSLEVLVNSHGAVWHCRTLDPSLFQGNQEEYCRLQRLSFFQELSLTHQYSAVLLAHHADDQAETVLKRIFEGAHLTSCKGMLPISEYRGLTVWRPLLHVKKSVITSWIAANGWKAIDDHTNRDEKYLRARMRSSIIPNLSHAFGKDISMPLAQLRADICELDDYLKGICRPFLDQLKVDWPGFMLSIDKECQLPAFVIRYLLRTLLRSIDRDVLARKQIEEAAQHILKRSANKIYSRGNAILYLDRGTIFVRPVVEERMIDSFSINVGLFEAPPWQVKVELSAHSAASHWRGCWEQTISITVPPGIYTLAPSRANACYLPKKCSLDDLWNHAKVPAFLRTLLPVVWDGDVVVGEFLSGFSPKVSSNALQWKISLIR